MSAVTEMLAARVRDLEDYTDETLDVLEDELRAQGWSAAVEVVQRRVADAELSQRITALEEEAADWRAHTGQSPLGAYADEPDETGLKIAINIGRVVTFKYRDRDGVSSYRVVSPYELREVRPGPIGDPGEPGNFTSLLAYDHGREGIRHFRVERIEGAVTFTDAEAYRPPEGV